MTGLPDESTWTDLGYGVQVATVHDSEGAVVGLLERHQCGDAYRAGSLPLQGARCWPAGWPSWRLQSLGPLDLAPSVRCPECGLHGWIREGLWVPVDMPDDRKR